MKVIYTVEINLEPVPDLLKKLGLDERGRVQRFLTSELFRLSSAYVPFRSGALQASGRVTDDYKAIEYRTPYARYHWYGKLMVDPFTRKGSFYDPKTGRHWSRPNWPKDLTDIDLHYNGAPLRGPRWVERAWLDNKDDIMNGIGRLIGGTQWQ